MDVGDEGRNVRKIPGQSIALGILICVTIAGLGFGVYAMVRTIREPFVSKGSGTTTSVARAEQDAAQNLKRQDVDGDFLSDYDETNVYQTSPYLRDSDSDSIDDKTELLAGTDPNCAAGTSCLDASAPSPNPPKSFSSISDLSPEAVSDAVTQSTSTSSSADLEKARAELEKLTPDQIRELLRKKGAPEEKLKTMTDEQLMQIYRQSIEQALEKQKNTTQSQSSSPTPLDTPPPASPSANLDPASMPIGQIRDLMLQTGKISKTDLDKIDDVTLRKLFVQAVNQAQMQQGPQGKSNP